MQVERIPRVASVEQRALGWAVRELRARRWMTQEGLGFYAGLNAKYVGALERGEINPTFATLVRLRRGLRLPLSEILAVYERHLRDAG